MTTINGRNKIAIGKATIGLLVAGALGAIGKGASVPRSMPKPLRRETTSSALVATISGTIRDTQGRPLSGVTVQLNGRTMATQVTGDAGTYSFALNVPGTTASWSVHADAERLFVQPRRREPEQHQRQPGPELHRLGNGLRGDRRRLSASRSPRPIPVLGPGARARAAPLAGLAAQELALVRRIAGSLRRGRLRVRRRRQRRGRQGPRPDVQRQLLQDVPPAAGDPAAPARACRARRTRFPNPQIALATLRGAINAIPSFISATSPAREARFPIAAGGGVAGLFTISGPGRRAGLHPRAAELRRAGRLGGHHLPHRHADLRRRPDGEHAGPDAGGEPDARRQRRSRCRGTAQHVGNDGTVTQVRLEGAEQVADDLRRRGVQRRAGRLERDFTNERSAVPGCVFNGSPEDHTNNHEVDSGTPAEVSGDTVLFAAFMRFLAPPTPARADGVDDALAAPSSWRSVAATATRRR